jgi:integrase
VFCKSIYLPIYESNFTRVGAGKRKQNPVLDVHSFRVTFGTNLARAGVPLRTAQELMRHSAPKLTANIYQDVGLLDIAGAVESLPAIPIRRQAVAAQA